jgi:hypothetical protein
VLERVGEGKPEDEKQGAAREVASLAEALSKDPKDEGAVQKVLNVLKQNYEWALPAIALAVKQFIR